MEYGGISFYHVFNKSIYGNIFNEDRDFERFKKTMIFYSYKENFTPSYKIFSKSKDQANFLNYTGNQTKIINIIAYCLMPNHFHILISQVQNYLSKYLNKLLDSYTKYFNIKYGRKGPLWQSRTKKILLDKDSYFIHLTRYIHLNPVTAYLTEKPEKWRFSSYREYINSKEDICEYKRYFPENYDFKTQYKKFTEDRIDYQRNLKEIEYLIKE